ncbi:hypothetical protein Pelo_18012 [Pelomyxa schiedti]|nr:hypothetical protein Pelo_18012 [Pelomyxa schiedti]
MIVWEWVLPWLVPAPLIHGPPTPTSGSDGTTRTRVKFKHTVTLCAIAEAMFPLVGRACKSIVSHYERWGTAVGVAAEAGSRLCVGWLLRNRRTAGPLDGADGVGGGGGGGGDEGNGVGVVPVPVQSVGGGGGDDDERRRRRKGNKAFLRVLEGLCVGGHLGMAQCLVDPGDRGGGGCDWAAGLGLVWLDGGGDDECVVDNGMVDHVRASDLLKSVCEKGHVEVAKWIVERFMVRETWEFAGPLSAAVSGGHLELAQWLVDTFDLAPKLSGCSWYFNIHEDSCKSGNVEVVKWCLEKFTVDRPFYTVQYCVTGKSSKSVEVCQLINKRISNPVSTHSLYGIHNLEVMKWAISAYPSIGTTEDNLATLCAGPEGVQFCQWLLDERSFTPTPSMFQAACKNTKDTTRTAKWLLSTRVSLSPEVICNSFSSSLAHNNTSIASWLDETFHILNPPNPNSNIVADAGSILVTLCKETRGYESRSGGMEWFLNHTSTKGVEEAVIVECIELLLDKPSYEAAILLMDHFHISEPKRNQLLVRLMEQAVQSGTLSQIKKVVSMGEFSKESVAKCLANSFGFESANTARWLINHFQLEHQHITLNNSMVLFNIIRWGQESCVEWLINKFHITLDEFLHLNWERDTCIRIDLFTWKVIQEVFPGLTADMIKERLLPLVCRSPVIAQVAMKRFPQLTMHDILAFCSRSSHPRVSVATHLWLRYHHP